MATIGGVDPKFTEFKTNMYDVEVINAGVGAADSREEAYKIKNIFKKFDPDLFIIYDGWNDSTKIQKEEEIDPRNLFDPGKVLFDIGPV